MLGTLVAAASAAANRNRPFSPGKAGGCIVRARLRARLPSRGDDANLGSLHASLRYRCHR